MNNQPTKSELETARTTIREILSKNEATITSLRASLEAQVLDGNPFALGTINGEGELTVYGEWSDPNKGGAKTRGFLNIAAVPATLCGTIFMTPTSAKKAILTLAAAGTPSFKITRRELIQSSISRAQAFRRTMEQTLAELETRISGFTA